MKPSGTFYRQAPRQFPREIRKMKKSYNLTICACFMGNVVQAIVNNFAPLLFVTFSREFDIPLSKITLLITLNFALQLVIDLLSAGFADKIGYRMSMCIAHVCSALGLVMMAFLPGLMKNHFAGLLISVCVYAVGGGLLEVLISPIVEACPTDSKEKAMSLLHSFYCWGHVAVVLISTFVFNVFGIENWRVLACVWTIVPIFNLILFTQVPIASIVPEGETGMSIGELAKSRLFWILFLMMICSGASEQAVSQWASAFAEMGLGVSKTMGDLAGPMLFAVMMGSSRAFYGRFGDRIELDRFMKCSGILCIGAYLCIGLVPNPVIGLLSCGICGLSVGIMWPGTFSRASASIKRGGTAMFALLALAGDLGCSGGPTVAGIASSLFGDDLKKGILAAVLFPAALTILLFVPAGSRGGKAARAVP